MSFLALILVACLEMAASPADQLLADFAKLGDKPQPEQIVPFIHPTRGLSVDTSPEGSSTPNWVKLTAANVKSDFNTTLKPLFDLGLFKATPHCEKADDLWACSLMTPTSMPRICELAEGPNGKLFFVRIFWVPAAPANDGDDDEDLPM